jgi:threonylcarbamoyladenosine tRNA methylthiotransferase MtaB
MRIFLDSVGCRLNQSEIERIARQLQADGHTLVSSPQEADVAILNTCAVTGQATSDSRQKVRQIYRAGTKQVLVTGCWATLEPEKVAAMAGVTRIVTNQDKDDLPGLFPAAQVDISAQTPGEKDDISTPRHRTRTFLKVQDGCDNRCTFCVTSLARGKSRSRPLEDVVADIQIASREGAQEVVLSGVHLGSWGHDLDGKLSIRRLIGAILQETDLPRLRLSSIEPWDLDEDFFELWQNPRLCRHLHLPLQSGCDSTLRRMARRTNQRTYHDLIASARKYCPQIAITTDIIVGFPGETEGEFADSQAFIGSLNFAGGHVFTYSARPGTAAALMPEQVPIQIRKARNAAIRQVFTEAGMRYRNAFINQTLMVLWETAKQTPDGWVLSGLSDNYIKVSAKSKKCLWNIISPTRIVEFEKESLAGILVS